MVAQLNPLLYSIWTFSILLESMLLAILIRRRNKHPLFGVYIAFCVSRSLLLFRASFGWPWVYWYSYWIGTVLEGGLLLAVTGELAIRVFRPAALRRAALEKFAGLLLIAVGVAVAISTRTPDAPMRVMALGRAIERTVTLSIFFGLTVMIWASDYMGLRWRRHAYGIAVGLTVNLAVSTVAQVLYSPYVMGPAAVLRYLQMFGFIFAQLIWIRCLARLEPDVTPVGKSELREVQRMAAEFVSLVGLLKAKTEVTDT